MLIGDFNMLLLLNFFKTINSFYTVLFSLNLIYILICFLLFDKKISIKYIYIFIGFLFYFIAFYFCLQSNNIIVFFIGYEFLLFISIIFLFFSSPNKRSKLVTIYFILWTQLGSFFVFLGILFLYYFYNILYFSQLNKNIIYYKNLNFISFLFFIGFGIKIPLWPFHFWLTKTHVEANTSFSIYLSGILVKVAVLGYYKFLFIFYCEINYIFFILIIISILDASLKLWIQDDLKKIVAILTIIEMNIITFLFLFFEQQSFYVVCLFFIFHSTISGFFFLLVDIIYKRTGKRSLTSISGLWKFTPILFYFTLFGLYLLNGFPITPKFNYEFFFLLKLITLDEFFLSLFIIITSCFSAILISKKFLFIYFGDNYKKIIFILNKKELLIIVIYIFIFFLLIFIS